MTDFDYGNARLRARRARLLDDADYRRLLGTGDLDRMLGELADGPYGPDVEAALARATGLERLDLAIRSHLARQLAELVGFYPERVAARLELIRWRWDVHNLRTLLRAAARTTPTEESVTALLVPAGSLDEAALTELSEREGVRGIVDTLVAWGVPSRDAARRLATAAAEFDRSGDLRGVEDRLNRVYAEHVDQVLSGGPDDELARVLRAEIDRLDLLTALRGGSAFLAGGELRPDRLEAAASAEEREAVPGLVGPLPVDGWDRALAGWVEDGDLAHLADRLDEAITRQAVEGFRHGDPLGMAVPVAFAWAKEREAENLRVVGRALVHGLGSEWADSAMVVAR